MARVKRSKYSAWIFLLIFLLFRSSRFVFSNVLIYIIIFVSIYFFFKSINKGHKGSYQRKAPEEIDTNEGDEDPVEDSEYAVEKSEVSVDDSEDSSEISEQLLKKIARSDEDQEILYDLWELKALRDDELISEGKYKRAMNKLEKKISKKAKKL